MRTWILLALCFSLSAAASAERVRAPEGGYFRGDTGVALGSMRTASGESGYGWSQHLGFGIYNRFNQSLAAGLRGDFTLNPGIGGSQLEEPGLTRVGVLLTAEGRVPLNRRASFLGVFVAEGGYHGEYRNTSVNLDDSGTLLVEGNWRGDDYAWYGQEVAHVRGGVEWWYDPESFIGVRTAWQQSIANSMNKALLSFVFQF